MQETRALILSHVLDLVPFDGWTDYTLRMATQRAKLAPSALRAAFPAGVKDCLDYFFAEQDAAQSTAFAGSGLARLRMPERIETLVLSRLERLLPHREAVRRAVAWQALPWNIAHTLPSLYRSIDLMWRLAGDKSTDFSFYTRRMTLASLYSSTLLYWLNDESEQQGDTRAFLTRRLSNIAAFGTWKKKCGERLKRAG